MYDNLIDNSNFEVVDLIDLIDLKQDLRYD